MGLFDNAKQKLNKMKQQSQEKKAHKQEIKKQMNEIKAKFDNIEPISDEEKAFYQENSLFGQGTIEKMALKAIDKDKKDYIKTLEIDYNIADNKKYFINKDEHYFSFNGVFPIFFAEIIKYTLDIEQETKTKGQTTGKTKKGVSLGKAALGGLIGGRVGAVIGGSQGRSNTNTSYDLTSYTEVKSYQLNISTINHGLIQLKFGPQDKTLVEQLLYCLDLSQSLKIDLQDELELYKNGTEKRLNELENKYKEIGYLN